MSAQRWVLSFTQPKERLCANRSILRYRTSTRRYIWKTRSGDLKARGHAADQDIRHRLEKSTKYWAPSIKSTLRSSRKRAFTQRHSNRAISSTLGETNCYHWRSRFLCQQARRQLADCQADSFPGRNRLQVTWPIPFRSGRYAHIYRLVETQAFRRLWKRRCERD